MVQPGLQAGDHLIATQQRAHIEHPRPLHAARHEQAVQRHHLADLQALGAEHFVEGALQGRWRQLSHPGQRGDVGFDRGGGFRFPTLLQFRFSLRIVL